MCEFCKWKELAAEIDEFLSKRKKKDFTTGLLTAIKQRMKREKHCTNNQRTILRNAKFIETNNKSRRKRKKK